MLDSMDACNNGDVVCAGRDVVSHNALDPVSDSARLLDAYEGIRHVLPVARYPNRHERFHDLEELTDRYDVFFFDAFGVLNVGETAIEKAAERVVAVRRAGKQVRIVSNAASAPVPLLKQKYDRLGYDFGVDEIITSRMALIDHLHTQPARHWGIMAPAGAETADLGIDASNLAECPDAFDEVDGFILLTASGWTQTLHKRLLSSVQVRPRTVLLANPDLAAPRETGFSVEPGQIADSLRCETGCQPVGFGKPYGSIFRIALDSVQGVTALDRVLMIGDTLHTDILGGCSAGLHTALVTAHGASASLDWGAAMRRTGIVPHHVLDHI